MRRREFFKNMGWGIGAGLFFWPELLKGEEKRLIKNIPACRVVQIHDPDASYWDFSSGYYADYVNQGLVDNMVDRGLCELTGLPDPVSAWQRIMSSYQTGDKVAIRINFNNCDSYYPSNNMIDSIIQPVNSIIKGLTSTGIPAEDIRVYDASRRLPHRFTSKCLYPGVKFYDSEGGNGNTEVTFNSTDPSRTVSFSNPDIAAREITDVLTDAQHLISVPLLKAHSTGVSGVFKLHMGTTNGPDYPAYTELHAYLYDLENNPLVDIYKNINIKEKTRLIVGDGLFGAKKYNATPERWSIFGNKSPNTLFFSLDPVALDTVMQDLLHTQWPTGAMPPDDHDHLHCAFRQGLGIHEHQDKNGKYSQIDRIRIEL